MSLTPPSLTLPRKGGAANIGVRLYSSSPLRGEGGMGVSRCIRNFLHA
jgi:hypothetical protein